MARVCPASIAILLLLALSFAAVQVSDAGPVPIADCPMACDYRCSATSHKKPCLGFCIMCCNKCLCVPSGTYGHKEECPCYNKLRTKEGKPKCP